MSSKSSDRAWQRWGEIDPYFGVLTSDAFRSHSIESHRQAFFESGETYIGELLDLVADRFPSAPRGVALDFGCGVGRLALPLARRFDRVVGLDISSGMLREAEANAESAGLTNLQFTLSDDTLSNAPDGLDLVHSQIVLQHIPVIRGMGYMDLMLAKLNSGGVASFHFTTDRGGSWPRRLLYWSRVNLPIMDKAVSLLSGRGLGEPMMQMNEYSFAEVIALYAKHSIQAPIVLLAPQRTTMALQLIGQKA